MTLNMTIDNGRMETMHLSFVGAYNAVSKIKAENYSDLFAIIGMLIDQFEADKGIEHDKMSQLLSELVEIREAIFDEYGSAAKSE